MPWYDELVERWRPSRGWRETVLPAARRVEKDPADMKAWRDIVIMLGDTHATELALIVCLHAQALGSDVLAGHLHLCLLDLGIASAPGPVPLRDPASVTTVDDDALARWTEAHLVPFDGDLARAAAFVLALARNKLA
jgi:hypothetical protein